MYLFVRPVQSLERPAKNRSCKNENGDLLLGKNICAVNRKSVESRSISRSRSNLLTTLEDRVKQLEACLKDSNSGSQEKANDCPIALTNDTRLQSSSPDPELLEISSSSSILNEALLPMIGGSTVLARDQHDGSQNYPQTPSNSDKEFRASNATPAPDGALEVSDGTSNMTEIVDFIPPRLKTSFDSLHYKQCGARLFGPAAHLLQPKGILCLTATGEVVQSLWSVQGLRWLREKANQASLQSLMETITLFIEMVNYAYSREFFSQSLVLKPFASLPPKNESLVLLNAYFDHLNPISPLFDQASFMQMFHSLSMGIQP